MYHLKPTLMVLSGAVVLGISTNLVAVISGALLVVAGILVFNMRLDARMRRLEAIAKYVDEKSTGVSSSAYEPERHRTDGT